MSIRASLMVLTLMLAPAAWAADAPDVDALRRDMLEFQEMRFRRAVEMADVCARRGKLDQAKELYGEALALRPDDAGVMDALLGVLRRQGDWAAQEPLYARLCARRPGDAPLAFDAAECLWRLGRTADAKRAWEEMLRRFPAEYQGYDRLIDFYAAEGEPAAARDVLKRRRDRFGDESALLLVEARLARTEKNADAEIAALLAALDGDLDDADRDRAETLLFAAAARAGRTPEVAKQFTDSLAATDAKLAARLIELAQAAADAKDFPAAARLAEGALAFLKDPAKRAGIAAKAAAWKAQAPPIAN